MFGVSIIIIVLLLIRCFYSFLLCVEVLYCLVIELVGRLFQCFLGASVSVVGRKGTIIFAQGGIVMLGGCVSWLVFF